MNSAKECLLAVNEMNYEEERKVVMIATTPIACNTKPEVNSGPYFKPKLLIEKQLANSVCIRTSGPLKGTNSNQLLLFPINLILCAY